MQVLKKIGLVLSVAVFGPLLIACVVLFTFHKTIGEPDYVKRGVAESQVYTSLSDTLIKRLSQDNGVGSNKVIVSALEDTFTAPAIQQVIEPGIDGLYKWLNANDNNPYIQLNLASLEKTFSQNLQKRLLARANKLPSCSALNPPTSSDVFAASCIPSGTNKKELARDSAAFVSEQANAFLRDHLIEDKKTSNKPHSSDIKVALPDTREVENGLHLYRTSKQSLVYFVGGLVLLGATIVLLSSTHLRGLRKLSVLLFFNGMTLVMCGFILIAVANTYAPESQPGDIVTQTSAAESAATTLARGWLIMLRNYGAVLAVAGLVGMIFATVFINKAKPKQTEEKNNADIAPEEPRANPENMGQNVDN